jgi:hypothetical protein
MPVESFIVRMPQTEMEHSSETKYSNLFISDESARIRQVLVGLSSYFICFVISFSRAGSAQYFAVTVDFTAKVDPFAA